MLVDAQLTKTNAERVLEEIKETKKPLSIVYITMRTPITFLVWRSLRSISGSENYRDLCGRRSNRHGLSRVATATGDSSGPNLSGSCTYR